MKSIDLFPIRIWTGYIDDNVTDRIKLIDESYRLKDNNKIGRDKSNYGGWHSQSVTENRLFDKLHKSILDIINNEIIPKEYEDSLYKLNMSVQEFDDSWVIINKKDDINFPHTHPGNWMSGAFYIKAPYVNCNESGPIIFNDMISARVNENFPFKSNLSKSYPLHPEDGKLILFPSWLPHRVHNHDAYDDRIVFSFNISIQLQDPLKQNWKINKGRYDG